MKRYDLLFGFLLGLATLLVIFLLSSDFAAHYEICEPAKEGAKECARYNVISFTFREIGAHLDSALITAFATAFIARYTFTLKQSTDRLWEAGKDQFELARTEFISTHRPKIRIKHVWLMNEFWYHHPLKSALFVSITALLTPVFWIMALILSQFAREPFCQPPTNAHLNARLLCC